MLLFCSDLLGTVKRVLFVPHSQGLKISLLLLSECCSLPKVAAGEAGRCSAVPEGDHCCSREEHTNTNLPVSHPKSCVSTPLSQGTATRCLCFSFLQSLACWEHLCASSTSQHQGLGAALPGAVQPSSNPQAAQQFDFGTCN